MTEKIINGKTVKIEPYSNLYGADLTGANLYGADLTGANLTEANLIETNITNTYNIVNKLSEKQEKQVKGIPYS